MDAVFTYSIETGDSAATAFRRASRHNRSKDEGSNGATLLPSAAALGGFANGQFPLSPFVLPLISPCL